MKVYLVLHRDYDETEMTVDQPEPWEARHTPGVCCTIGGTAEISWPQKES